MRSLRDTFHQAGVLARLAAHALRSRLAGDREPPPDHAAFRRRCERWLRDTRGGEIAEHELVEVPANRPPWIETAIDLEPGDTVTTLAVGRVYLARALDIWVGPHFQLWLRVGGDGEVFRGTRSTHTFTAERAGRLHLASYFPGEWADRQGRLATDESDYRKVSGRMTCLVLRWAPGVDPHRALAELGRSEHAPSQALDECRRMEDPDRTPADWRYLWLLGPAEIFRLESGPDAHAGAPVMRCHTDREVGILQRDVRLPLSPRTRLRWQWRVDELPSRLAENTVPTHDYLSIAVEFENGRDITWHWSAELPPETVYKCPLPTWHERETHIVIRSGEDRLGEWLTEERNVHDDCVRALGAPAAEIRRVWLIANSLFQRKPGHCEYRDVRLVDASDDVRIV